MGRVSARRFRSHPARDPLTDGSRADRSGGSATVPQPASLPDGRTELKGAQRSWPRQMTGQHRQAAMRHRSTARLLVSNGLIPATLPAVHELVTEPTTIRERGRDHRPLELRVTLLAPAVNFRPSGCGSTCWTFSFSG